MTLKFVLLLCCIFLTHLEVVHSAMKKRNAFFFTTWEKEEWNCLLLVPGSSSQCANDKPEVQRQGRLSQRHTGGQCRTHLDSPPASCLAIHAALPYDYCFKKGKLISYEKLEKHPGSQLHNRNVPFYLQAEFLFFFFKSLFRCSVIRLFHYRTGNMQSFRIHPSHQTFNTL